MSPRYDIFISYRRDDGAQYARILQLELEKRGYKVFLDYEELKDGVFGDNIREAIKSTPIFMMVLTPLYLERSMERDSWVREEIEMAMVSNMHFIPVDPDHKFAGIPNGTPKEIADIVNNHQHSAIDFGQALGATVDLMAQNRITPHLQGKKRKGNKLTLLVSVVSFILLLIICGFLFFPSKTYTSTRKEPSAFTKSYSEQLVTAAKQGDTLAQYYMGLVMENGYGITANASEAVNWYKCAAEQGMDSAQVNLATCYMEGIGITKDESEAVKWLNCAIEKGNTYAMTNLGIYLLNKGKEAEGCEWLKRAADKGNRNAKQIMEELSL
jgi:hypothetical protein